MIIAAGTIGFQPFIRLAHEKGWSGSDYSCQRVHDCCGAVWVFRFPFVFAAVPVGGFPMGWARARWMLRSTIMWRCNFSSRHMNWLHCLLERWRSGQPLYHELLPDGRVRLEQRLPLCRCCSDDFDSGVIPQPSALEAAPIRRGGRGERGKGAEPAAGRKDQGRAVRFNHAFLATVHWSRRRVFGPAAIWCSFAGWIPIPPHGLPRCFISALRRGASSADLLRNAWATGV